MNVEVLHDLGFGAAITLIMESLRSLVIKLYFAVFYHLRSFPYKLIWKPGFKLYLSFNVDSKFNLFIYGLSCLAFPTYAIVLIIQLIIHFPDYKATTKGFVHLALHFLWSTGYTCITLCRACYIFAIKDVLNLANGTEDLITHLETHEFGQGAFQKSAKLREKILTILCIQAFELIVICMIPLMFLFEGGLWIMGTYVSRFLLFAFPQWKATSFGIGLVTDILAMLTITGVMFLCFHINLLYMQTFKTGIELILRRRQVSKARQKLLNNGKVEMHLSFQGKEQLGTRNLRQDLQTYSNLRILSTLYSETFGNTFVPTLFSMLATMVILGMLLGIRLSHNDPVIITLGLSLWICGSAVLILFSTFTSMVHEYSKKLEKNLKQRRCTLRSKEARRLVKAFKVEVVRSGCFYPIRRNTCLTMLGLLANVAGSMLISFKL